VGEHCAYLFACKHHWQARWPACAQSPVQTAQVFFLKLLIQKQQCAESLILRRGSHVPLGRQMGEKLHDLGFCHFAWVTFRVEEK